MDEKQLLILIFYKTALPYTFASYPDPKQQDLFLPMMGN
jgi:hypothetical protein